MEYAEEEKTNAPTETLKKKMKEFWGLHWWTVAKTPHSLFREPGFDL